MTFIFGFLLMLSLLSLLTLYVLSINKLSEAVGNRFGLESAIFFNGIIHTSALFAVIFSILEG